MRPVPATATFTRADALALGWSDAALRRAVTSGRLIRLRRGHFTAGPVDGVVQAIAAARACGGSVISHRSALLVHGVPVLGRDPSVPELTVPPRRRVDVPDAHVHRAGMPDDHVVVVGNVSVTSVARTLIDVARHRSLAAAVSAIDFALHEGMTDFDELHDVLRFCWNWPRIRRAARAIRLSDERSESVLESVSRLALRWLRLPTPELQIAVLDRYGYLAGRVDFYWEEFGVAGEADGKSKYVADSVVTDEKYRQEKLEDERLVFVRWGWSDVVSRPRLLKARVESAFERGLARDRSGLTRLWSVSRRQTGDTTVKRELRGR